MSIAKDLRDEGGVALAKFILYRVINYTTRLITVRTQARGKGGLHPDFLSSVSCLNDIGSSPLNPPSNARAGITLTRAL